MIICDVCAANPATCVEPLGDLNEAWFACDDCCDHSVHECVPIIQPTDEGGEDR